MGGEGADDRKFTTVGELDFQVERAVRDLAFFRLEDKMPVEQAGGFFSVSWDSDNGLCEGGRLPQFETCSLECDGG